ncbi:MAG: hypothetical protein WCK81_14635 [Betaproteobacteria bacterium]
MKRSRSAKYAIALLPVVLLTSLVAGLISQSATATNPNTFTQLYICGSSGNEICTVGAVGPGGGTIFLVDYRAIYRGFHYLEAAPADWAGSLGVDPKAQWCSNISSKIQVTLNAWSSRAVGLGQSNTMTMLKNCTFGAANLVASYNASSRSTQKDWYLPSIGELILLSNNLQGLAGLLASDYWSSSGYSDIGGWVQSIDHGYQGNATKDTLYHVRPVRRF